MQFANDDKELILPGGYKEDDSRGVFIRRMEIASNVTKSEKKLDGEYWGSMSRDGTLAVTYPASPAKSAHVWDLTTMKKITLEADGYFWWTAHICPQNKTIVTFHPNETRIWDSPTGKLRHKIARADSKFSAPDPFRVSFAGDGKTFHLSYPLMCLTIWDAYAGKPLSEKLWRCPGGALVTLLPDGKHVLTSISGPAEKNHRGDMMIFNIDTREPVLRLQGTDRVMNLADLAVSADGSTVAQSTSYGTISIWKLPKLGEAAPPKP